MSVRAALPEDIDRIHQLIVELAEYERSAHEVVATTDDLRRDIFAENPRVHVHVATDGQTNEVVGFALWYVNYSTWLGRHGIYLEDLYVKETERGRGYGKALLATLAKICVDRGYGRLEWWVLDWNQPAIDFYRRIGAEPMDEWTVNRVTGEALEALAAIA